MFRKLDKSGGNKTGETEKVSKFNSKQDIYIYIYIYILKKNEYFKSKYIFLEFIR